MAKTLSESAAEILKASMGAAGKEPMQKMPAEVDELGGEHSDGTIDAIAAKAAADMKVAPKPGVSGPAGDVKPVKGAGAGGMRGDLPAPTMGYTKVKEESETSEEESVLAEVEASTEEVVEEEVADLTEEDLAEAKKTMMKDMVAKHKGSMAEDVDALFNGESLSEEFRTKATTIFEAAVQSRVEKIVEDVINENDEVLAEAYEEIKNELTAQVDEYLNYVVEQWVEQNQVAIETGLRAELTEDFINGLKTLFAEHYIEIPEEKVDVAEELAVKVVELEEAAAAVAAEKAALVEELNAAKKNEAIRKICEGLTEVQISKMKSLAEGVEFTTEGEFNNKLAVIRENYFPANKVTSEVKKIQETTVSEDAGETVEVQGLMKHYVQAITKTAAKA
jgi:hypothetical protein